MTIQLIATISVLFFFCYFITAKRFLSLTVGQRIISVDILLKKKIVLITQIALICPEKRAPFEFKFAYRSLFWTESLSCCFYKTKLWILFTAKVNFLFRLPTAGDDTSKILCMYGILVSVFAFVPSNETKEPSFDCFQYETIFWSLD